MTSQFVALVFYLFFVSTVILRSEKSSWLIFAFILISGLVTAILIVDISQREDKRHASHRTD